ncbi:MAG: hypothetical protein GY913_32990 [Proteobacteria bacterium]|nr:hypothetical protein [Pseudomonadota bacterium]MCP4921741.1 hypothetical protein [Pseudomonadota bacterium]
MILALLACNGETTELPPDFNYIPIYSDVCLPGSLDEQDAARAQVDAHIDASEFLVGTNMDLCHEDSCVPCDTTSNPMLATVRDFDDWSTTEAQAIVAAVDGDVDLEGYFATALDTSGAAFCSARRPTPMGRPA